MKRRGQAAMEFLMTYGWAILAAIIVIGVIAFYILPNLGSGGSSNLQQPFYVAPEEVHLNTTGLIVKVSYNGNGIATIAAINSTSGSTSCTNTSTIISSGAKKEIVLTCSPALVVGDKFNGKTTIYYTVGSGGYNQIGTGVFVGQVQVN